MELRSQFYIFFFFYSVAFLQISSQYKYDSSHYYTCTHRHVHTRTHIYSCNKCERVVLILCSLHMNCSFCLSFCCLNNADILFLHHSCDLHVYVLAYIVFATVIPCIQPFYSTNSLKQNNFVLFCFFLLRSHENLICD